jgi:putative transcriptional regulator
MERGIAAASQKIRGRFMKKATNKKKARKPAKKKNNYMFNGLIEGLKQAAAHATGEIKLDSYFVPNPVDVKAIRAKLRLSQSEFSERYGFPIRTLQDWELGRNQPPGPVRCYLLVIEREPKKVEKILREAEDGPKHRPVERGAA